MKKILKIVALILCFVSAFCLFGCEKKPKDKGYVIVSFETNWNEITFKPVTLDGAEEKFMPEMPDRAGYTFAGWYYDSAFAARFSTDDALTQDVTLYAKWLPNEIEKPDYPIIEDPKGLVFAEDGQYYTVTGYNGDDGDITVPARYNTKAVTKIADGAFKDNSTLTSVKFGLNIEYVGKDAFRGCTKLKSITVEKGSNFYVSAEGLLYNRSMSMLIVAPQKTTAAEITFGKELENICDYALENCEFKAEFASGSKYEIIEENDFSGFKGELVIGKSVTAIMGNAFKNATAKIRFAADCLLNTVGVGSFDGYAGESLILPSSIKSIGGGAFNDCTATVDISRVATDTIGSQAFVGYKGKSLTIPINITVIEKNAFTRSTTTINFASGSNYKTVGSLAFNQFDGTVNLPFTVEKVEKNAFYGAHATVNFDCAAGEVELVSGWDGQFKGKVVYLR